MTIKSLLLGSAAALAAVSGAQAADAIVAAEPEPMEYVKVCDAYGDGYFYIPGTETCLKLSGFLRYETVYNFTAKTPDYGLFRYRAVFDAKNDSEYGTVYSRVLLEGQTTSNAKMQDANRGALGYMGIGGLELGIYDNQWTRFFGYGGYNTMWDGYYGYAANQYVSYTADLGAAKAFGAIDWLGAGNQLGYTVGVSGALGSANAALGFAYDTLADAYTVKGSVDGTFGIASAKLMLAYANKANWYTFDTTRYGGTHYGFMVLGSVNVAVTDSLSVYSTAGYLQKPSSYAYISGGVKWDVASGFAASAELDYEYDYATSTGTTYAGLRIQRSF